MDIEFFEESFPWRGQCYEDAYEVNFDPKEVAEYTSFAISFDNELISEEIRLNRVVI